MECNNTSSLNKKTEHLFRETYQEVFSALIIKFGKDNIDIVEDALQDTFYTALKSWSYNNYPKNPKAWLYTAAKNNTINQLKRNAKSQSFENIDFETEGYTIQPKEDDQLKLLRVCASLKINAKAKLIFTLKSICGYGVQEIANSLQLSEENIYKQLQRGKTKLKALPKQKFLSKTPSVFSEEDVSYIESIIYFMFNEGYDSVSSTSKQAINEDICYEAVRLAHLLVQKTDKDSTKHLLALCYFHMARFYSRLNSDNEFISLRKQDRTLWNKNLISIGFKYLVKPSSINRFYIEALIASIHLKSKFFETTNWQQILELYSTLLKLNESPIVRLNRAICLFELGQNTEATNELQQLKPILEDSYLYYSISMAEYLEDKDEALSKMWYKKSLQSTKQPFRKQIIKRKLDNIS